MGHASAAAGWTVKDVVAHFGDLLVILASAIGGTLSTVLGIERLNDAHIAAKSSWSSGQSQGGSCSARWPSGVVTSVNGRPAR